MARLHTAELALASDGSLLLNVSALCDASGLRNAMSAAARLKGDVFVGIRLDARCAAEVRRELELILPNATWDVVAKMRRADRRRRSR